MKRVMISALISALAVGLVAFAAEAQQRRNRRGNNRARQAQQQQERRIPNSPAIAEAMGDVQWGMSKAKLMAHFQKQIREKYRPRLAKAAGAIEEDRLRHQMNDELHRLRSSYVQFNGRTTGWDVSFLQREYTHRNNEAMFVVREQDSQNFFFFINDRLWKWYRAFNAEVFAGRSFDQFAQALEGRFGPARRREGETYPGGGTRQWLEWQNESTSLRAIDENRFYGFYCLVFTDRETLGNIDNLRTNRSEPRNSRHALVDAVTVPEGDSGGEAGDGNADIVDRLTGRIRNRQQAPENSGGAARGGTSGRSGSRSTPAQSRDGTGIDDDPLSGI